jgi:hypothetical protein
LYYLINKYNVLEHIYIFDKKYKIYSNGVIIRMDNNQKLSHYYMNDYYMVDLLINDHLINYKVIELLYYCFLCYDNNYINKLEDYNIKTNDKYVWYKDESDKSNMDISNLYLKYRYVTYNDIIELNDLLFNDENQQNNDFVIKHDIYGIRIANTSCYISNSGKIFNIILNRNVKTEIDKNYEFISFTTNNSIKKLAVHILVYYYYGEIKKSNSFLVHIDGDITNNNISNLKLLKNRTILRFTNNKLSKTYNSYIDVWKEFPNIKHKELDNACITNSYLHSFIWQYEDLMSRFIITNDGNNFNKMNYKITNKGIITYYNNTTHTTCNLNNNKISTSVRLLTDSGICVTYNINKLIKNTFYDK